MEFYTQYKRPGNDVCRLENHPDEGLVERAGYMTVEDQVNMMMEAGERLEVFRLAEFPGDGDVPEDAPANEPLNMLDALQKAKELRDNIRRRREELINKSNENVNLDKKEEKVIEGGKKDGD